MGMKKMNNNITHNGDFEVMPTQSENLDRLKAEMEDAEKAEAEARENAAKADRELFIARQKFHNYKRLVWMDSDKAIEQYKAGLLEWLNTEIAQADIEWGGKVFGSAIEKGVLEKVKKRIEGEK